MIPPSLTDWPTISARLIASTHARNDGGADFVWSQIALADLRGRAQPIALGELAMSVSDDIGYRFALRALEVSAVKRRANSRILFTPDAPRRTRNS